MKNKTKFLSMIFILIISLSSTASAREITVDDDYGANYTSIQEAVDNSTTGDTIIVRPGIYTENIVVNTTDLTIESELNNSDVQVKPLNESVSTFWITANNTTISGLNITGASENFRKLAIIVDSNMNNVTGNTIENGCIELGTERIDNLIAENKILNGVGIYINWCELNTNILSGNTISNCSAGIYEYDQGADIRNNIITDCNYGIELNTSNSGVDNNTILNCDVGILLGEGSSPTIINNTIMSCAECGIYDMDGNSSKLIYNNYFNNTLNVRFEAGKGGSIWNSSLTTGTNIVGGPYIGGNFWANPNGTGFSQTANDSNSDGICDQPPYNISENDYDYLPLVYYTSPQNPVTPTANFTTNVSSGYVPLTVQFTDLSQNATGWSWNFGDGNTSNVRNTTHTYFAAGNHTVTLTASNENGTATQTAIISAMQQQGGNGSTILPDASFTASPSSGDYPLTVLFTDTSQNSTSRSWDVNGDGAVDSTDASFSYTYNSRGDYPATLTARNANGTDTASTTISVTRRSSGSSSGGGGGGGGSPEPAKNVKVKELAQVFITNGKAVKFDFTKNATAVLNLSFDPKKTVGKTTTTIEMLKNRSTLTSDAPEDEVYNYLNIWVGNGGYGSDENNLENATICFKVEKSWIQDKNISQSSIILNRYNNKTWNELPTSYLKEDGKYLYFIAKTPGFSPFAVTGKAKITENNIPSSLDEAVDHTQNNAGNTTENMEQAPEETQSSSTSGEEDISASDYIVAFVIVCLLCVLGVFVLKME